MTIIQNHSKHVHLDTHFLYKKDNHAGGLACQAAIMNKARHPDIKLTCLSNKNKIVNLEDFFDGNIEKPVAKDLPIVPLSNEKTINADTNVPPIVVGSTKNSLDSSMFSTPNFCSFRFPTVIQNPYNNVLQFSSNSFNTTAYGHMYNPYNTPYQFYSNMMRPYYLPISLHFIVPSAPNTVDVPKVASMVAPQNHTVNNIIYNGLVTINKVYKVANFYVKKR